MRNAFVLGEIGHESFSPSWRFLFKQGSNGHVVQFHDAHAWRWWDERNQVGKKDLVSFLDQDADALLCVCHHGNAVCTVSEWAVKNIVTFWHSIQSDLGFEGSSLQSSASGAWGKVFVVDPNFGVIGQSTILVKILKGFGNLPPDRFKEEAIVISNILACHTALLPDWHSLPIFLLKKKKYIWFSHLSDTEAPKILTLSFQQLKREYNAYKRSL